MAPLLEKGLKLLASRDMRTSGRRAARLGARTSQAGAPGLPDTLEPFVLTSQATRKASLDNREKFRSKRKRVRKRGGGIYLYSVGPIGVTVGERGKMSVPRGNVIPARYPLLD